MALTPEVRSSQAGTTAITEATTDVRTSQLGVFAVASKPTEYVNSSQVGAFAVTDADNTLRVSQLGLMIVARGRVNDPTVRGWGFPLDDHEYYVLRLGNTETLIVDITTGQFYNWGSGDSPLWRAYDGWSWLGGSRLGAPFGTNIVVGDDGNGALYFLQPDGDLDDDALSGSENPRPFTREATGQIVTKGYSRTPCYRVSVFGSIGQQPNPSISSVTLSYSDDRGASYINLSPISVADSDYHARLDWRSLGSMKAPGRLFKITDNGALRRIDVVELGDE